MKKLQSVELGAEFCRDVSSSTQNSQKNTFLVMKFGGSSLADYLSVPCFDVRTVLKTDHHNGKADPDIPRIHKLVEEMLILDATEEAREGSCCA